MTPGLLFAGIIVVAGLIVCRRVMKAGTTSWEQARDKYRARIQEEEKSLQDNTKSMTLEEQMHLLNVALKDLLRLEGDKPSYGLTQKHQTEFVLESPQGTMTITFHMREQKLRATQQVLRGHERWKLSFNGIDEEFTNIASLMTRINEHLHDEGCAMPPEMAHLARRFRHLRKP